LNLVQLTGKRQNEFLVFVFCVLFWAFPFQGTACGESLVDIRVNGILASENIKTSYTLSINDCTELNTISYSVGSVDGLLSTSDAKRIPGSTSGCQVVIQGEGVDSHDPQITLNFRDGSSQFHTENFKNEKNAPQLSFQDISFAYVDGLQKIITTAKVRDDVDISYVGFSIVGIRASDLRSNGGIVALAREKSFAKTNRIEKVYPAYEGQDLFSLPLDVFSELDAGSIAHDGVVLVDIVAVDSSGNQSALSPAIPVMNHSSSQN
jgi:hypothetical protein